MATIPRTMLLFAEFCSRACVSWSLLKTELVTIAFFSGTCCKAPAILHLPHHNRTPWCLWAKKCWLMYWPPPPLWGRPLCPPGTLEGWRCFGHGAAGAAAAQSWRHSSRAISEGLAVALLSLFLEDVPFHHIGLKPVLLTLFTCQLLAAVGHHGDRLCCRACRHPACPFSRLHGKQGSGCLLRKEQLAEGLRRWGPAWARGSPWPWSSPYLSPGVGERPGHWATLSWPRSCCKAGRALQCAQREGGKDEKTDLMGRGTLVCLAACFSWQ